MAKDRSESEKKDRKEKKSRHSDTNGITKSKSEKKDKKRSRESGVSAVSNDASMMEEGDTSIAPAVDDDGDAVITGTHEGSDGKKLPKEIIVGASVPFANPLVEDKAMKKVLKGVKKGMSHANPPQNPPHPCSLSTTLAAKYKTLRRGVKEVVKAVRKSSTAASSPPHAVVILAADISPIDVITHSPILCEDHNTPYVFVPSRAELGVAGNTKRPTSVVMISSSIPEKKQKPAKDGEQADGKAGKVDKKQQEEWVEAYADLVKVVEKAGKDVRV